MLIIQGSHRPGKVLEFYLGPGKLLEFQNSTICPGNVLEFCKIVLENVKLPLKIIKYTDSFPFFWIYAMPERENCVKIAGFVEGRGGTVLRFSLPVVPVFINTIMKIFR